MVRPAKVPSPIHLAKGPCVIRPAKDPSPIHLAKDSCLIHPVTGRRLIDPAAEGGA